MRFGSLRGATAKILRDTRDVVNPFGYKNSRGEPFVATIRRGLNQEWVDHLATIYAGGKAGREDRKRRFVSNLKASADAGRGFRRGAKGSANPQQRVYEELAEQVFAQGEDPALKAAADLKRKQGAAKFLFVGGSGLDGEPGRPVDLSDPAEREALLTLAWWDEEKTQPAICEAKHLWDWNDEGQRFVPRLDPDTGEPVPNPFYMKPLGDSFLAWIEDEADDLEAFYQDAAETIAGN